MQTYLGKLIATALLCGLCARLAPKGNGGFARHIRLIGSVCLALTLTLPLQTLIDGGKTLSEALHDWLCSIDQDSLTENAEHADTTRLDGNFAALGVSQLLCTEFSLDPTQVSVSVRLNDDATALACVKIGLSGSAVWQDSHKIEEWVAQTLGCEAVVYIESIRTEGTT